MSWQLIYTSAPRGLTPGQTGFCTVARSADLREALAQKLEQISYYEHPRFPAGAGQPIISAFRIIEIRGMHYYVLTKVRDAGLDFTNRTNHLAHHLIFEEGELGKLPDPASILLKWNGWCERWSGEPRLIAPNAGNLSEIPRRLESPALTWANVSGDSGRAAALVEPPHSRGVFLLADNLDDRTILQMFSESLRLIDPEGKSGAATWRFPFTTFFQGGDLTTDFAWRCCRTRTPG